MAAAGTLLSDLDSSGTGGGDGDLVQRILSDMNIPTDNNRGSNIPPPMPMQTPPSYNQMQPSTQSITMDSHIPNAHMIGTEHPTPADFSAAMASVHDNRGNMQNPSYEHNPTAPIPGALHYEAPSKNIYSTIISEIKIPFIVTLLFFIFSLSPVRVLVSHYMPSFIKATGEFHLTGLLAISVMVGFTFWILHRVIAPLLSL